MLTRTHTAASDNNGLETAEFHVVVKDVATCRKIAQTLQVARIHWSFRGLQVYLECGSAPRPVACCNSERLHRRHNGGAAGLKYLERRGDSNADPNLGKVGTTIFL